MRAILQHKPLRLVFVANAVSMAGSGMNSAAVTWYILQATHSENALGMMMVFTTIPAMLTMPFTGVIIDRQDRRRLLMLLDLARAVVILVMAVLAFRHQVQVWQLYGMVVLVAAGFWMFWPTITALIQELTPGAEFIHANTFLLAGIQGGWLLAGAVVGFVYNHIGLGGVLLLDVASYLVSFLCYLWVRKGRVVVTAEGTPHHLLPEGAVAKFAHELHQGYDYLRQHRYVVLLGVSWSLFIAAMLAQGVVGAPLSDRILHAGAVGYGWLNAGWAIGAFTSTAYAAAAIRAMRSRRSVAVSMALLAACLFLAPFSRWLAMAVVIYAVMGSARGVGGVAISSSMMEMVPKHFMGRVQNTFYFGATLLQVLLSLAVGAVSHRIGLSLGFALIGTTYLIASLTAAWPVKITAPPEAEPEPAPEIAG